MEQIRQAYAALAEQYIELFGDSTEVHPDDLALITRHLSISPGTVLDVGCGPGHLTSHLRLLGVDASGIDLVPEFVDHARAAYPDSQFQIGSMDRLPVPDNSIAGILTWYSLIHVPPDDLDGVLAELRRVMIPGGTLVVGFFDGDDVVAFEHKVVTAYYWPAEELTARLRQAGFAEIDRHRRAGVHKAGSRPQAAIAAIAS